MKEYETIKFRREDSSIKKVSRNSLGDWNKYINSIIQNKTRKSVRKVSETQKIFAIFKFY